jgi:cytochrome P450
MIAKESMRLYPPAYGVGREVVSDCVIGGYTIPRKSQVFMFTWALHRDPRYFKDPNTFRPERWEEDSINNLPKYAYFPFGGGPRACIGSYFAMMEIVLVLATIAQRFHFSPVSDEPVALMPAMSLRPKGAINLKLQSRRG